MYSDRSKNGFTLVEILFAVVLVGLAIASLVGASLSFTKANAAGINLTTAEFLIEQVKQLMDQLAVVDPQTTTATFGPEEASLAAYDDLDDFSGASFSPPINAARETLGDFAGYTQQITVQNVNVANFDQTAANHTSDFVKVTVTVSLNSTAISSTSWIRARY